MAKVFLVKDYDPLILLNIKFCIQWGLYFETPVLVPGDILGEVYLWGQEWDRRSLSIGDLMEVGIPITKEEYQEAFEKATANGFQIK